MSVGVPVPRGAAQSLLQPPPRPDAPPEDAPVPVAAFAPVFSTTTAPTAAPTAAPTTAPTAGEGAGEGAVRAGGSAPRAGTGDRLAPAVAVVVMTVFGVLIVSGRVVTEGPVVLVLTRTHGVHLGDLCALAAWALGVGTSLGPAARRLARTLPPGARGLRSRTPATSGGATRRRG